MMKTMLPLSTREELRMRLECERGRLQEQIVALREAEGLDRSRGPVGWREEVTDQAEQGMDQAEWDRVHVQELALADRLGEVAHALNTGPGGSSGAAFIHSLGASGVSGASSDSDRWQLCTHAPSSTHHHPHTIIA